MTTIEKLKELERIIQISIDWTYNDEYTESEVKELIGSYWDLTPEDITYEICELIRQL